MRLITERVRIMPPDLDPHLHRVMHTYHLSTDKRRHTDFYICGTTTAADRLVYALEQRIPTNPSLGE